MYQNESWLFEQYVQDVNLGALGQRSGNHRYIWSGKDCGLIPDGAISVRKHPLLKAGDVVAIDGMKFRLVEPRRAAMGWYACKVGGWGTVHYWKASIGCMAWSFNQKVLATLSVWGIGYHPPGQMLSWRNFGTNRWPEKMDKREGRNE